MLPVGLGLVVQFVRYDLLQPGAEPGLAMITYTGPGTTSHDDFPLLASWAAGQDHETDQAEAASTSRPSTSPSRDDRAG